jgi:hypothetical protein
MATLEELEEAIKREAQAGNTDNQQRLSDAIREHPTFQGNAKRAIENETYKLAEDGYTELSKGEQRKKLSTLTARSMGVDDGDVDLEKGMGGWGRFKLSLLTDEKSKIDYLEKTYGRENLNIVDVGGKQKVLFRDENETKGKWSAVDEEGVSLADFTSDIAGEVIPTVTSVAGAIGGGLLGSAAGPAGTVGGAVVGGALGEVAGAAQDVIARKLLGVDVNAGQIAESRGERALVGGVFDVATAGVTKMFKPVITKFVGDKILSTSVKETLESLERQTAKTGLKEDLAPLLAASDASQAARTRRLSKTPEGREASLIGKFHDLTREITETARGRLKSDVPIEEVIVKKANEMRELAKSNAREVANLKREAAAAGREATKEKSAMSYDVRRKMEAKAAAEAAEQEKAIDYTIDKLIQKQLKGADKLRQAAGEKIRTSVLGGANADEKIVDDFYKNAEKTMNAPIYKIRDKHSLEPVEKAFSRVMKKFSIARVGDENSYKLLEARFGKIIADDLLTLEADIAADTVVGIKKLNEMVRRIESRVNWKKEAAFSEDERIIKDLAVSMRKVRDDAFEKIGSAPAQAFKDANKEYRKRILPRTENITKSARQKIAGGSDDAVANERLVDEALSDSQSIRQTIRSADDPKEMRKLLQQQYSASIIDVGTRRAIAMDKDKIFALWPIKSERDVVVKRLNRINELIENRKITPETVHASQVAAELGDPLTPSAARQMQLLERAAKIEAEGKEAAFQALKKMAKGDAAIPENIQAFRREFVDLDAGDQKKLLDKLSKSEKKSLQSASLEELIERHQGGAQKSSRFDGSSPIFNPDTMYDDLKKHSSKWRTAMGDETYEDMLDAATILRKEKIPASVDPATGNTFVPKANIGGDGGGGGGIIFYATGPVRWLGRKAMDILHGSGRIAGIFEEFATTKTLDPDTFRNIIIGSMATTEGLHSVMDEADKDPEFKEWLEKELSDSE